MEIAHICQNMSKNPYLKVITTKNVTKNGKVTGK